MAQRLEGDVGVGRVVADIRPDAWGIDCPVAEHARRLLSADSARRASALLRRAVPGAAILRSVAGVAATGTSIESSATPRTARSEAGAGPAT